MIILGIETSCDETSVGIVETIGQKLTLKSNVVASSMQLHAQTGGVIPEIAAREQIKYILPVLEQSIKNTFGDTNYHKRQNLNRFTTGELIDAIAVTFGPGLIGSLLVGAESAKTLSFLWKKPIIPVNHMMGHIYANWLDVDSQPEFPLIALVVSGNHTDLLLMKKHGDYEVIGGTRDDAAGECFDKCSRLLDFPYPGGPKISKLAEKGNPNTFHLPRPMISENNFDFSFSGLKTAFFRLTQQHFPIQRLELSSKKTNWSHISLESKLSNSEKQILYDLCASLQGAIIDVLVKKTLIAAEKYQVKTILLAGGVAANKMLREQMKIKSLRLDSNPKVLVPKKYLCTDNGAMIAAAAVYSYNPVPWKEITVNPELYY